MALFRAFRWYRIAVVYSLIAVIGVVNLYPHLIIGDGEGELIGAEGTASTGNPVQDLLASIFRRPPEPMSFQYAPGVFPEEPPYRFFRTLANVTGTRVVYDFIRRPIGAPKDEAERAAMRAEFVALQQVALPIPVSRDFTITGVSDAEGRAEFHLLYNTTAAEVAAMSFVHIRQELTARFCATESLDTLFLLNVHARLRINDRNGVPLYYFDIDPELC